MGHVEPITQSGDFTAGVAPPIPSIPFHHDIMTTQLQNLITLTDALIEASTDLTVTTHLEEIANHIESIQERLSDLEREAEAEAEANRDPLDDGDWSYDAWKDDQLTG